MSKTLKFVVTDILIGEQITIEYVDKEFKMSGIVINETRNTLQIKENKTGKIKTFPKNRINLIRKYKGSNIRIAGKQLKGRPEERIKLEPKKMW